MNIHGMLWVKLVDPPFTILFLNSVSSVCGWFRTHDHVALIFAERNYFIPNLSSDS